jgi:hypothetical protein
MIDGKGPGNTLGNEVTGELISFSASMLYLTTNKSSAYGIACQEASPSGLFPLLIDGCCPTALQAWMHENEYLCRGPGTFGCCLPLLPFFEAIAICHF